MDNENKKVKRLRAEAEFWTRIAHRLREAEDIYPDREYKILTLRRHIAGIRDSVNNEIAWAIEDEDRRIQAEIAEVDGDHA